MVKTYTNSDGQGGMNSVSDKGAFGAFRSDADSKLSDVNIKDLHDSCSSRMHYDEYEDDNSVDFWMWKIMKDQNDLGDIKLKKFWS